MAKPGALVVHGAMSWPKWFQVVRQASSVGGDPTRDPRPLRLFLERAERTGSFPETLGARGVAGNHTRKARCQARGGAHGDEREPARRPRRARAPSTRRRAPPCPEPVSAPLGRALPPTSPPPLTPGPLSRRPIRGPPRPHQLRPYCTVPGGSQAVVPRELCQRLELRAAARREQRLSECGMRRSKTPSWDPSA